MSLDPHWVFTATAPPLYCSYPDASPPLELPAWTSVSTALLCLRQLLMDTGLDRSRHGSTEWNPLGAIINEGDKVVIKPNWVHHHNRSGEGLDCLVTHTSVIEAILHYVVKARPKVILVCDAPIQGCDFEALMASCRVPQMIAQFAANGACIVAKDWRRTIRQSEKLSARSIEGCRPRDEYILYDLNHHSALEAITTRRSFRVAMYNPDWLERTHAKGKHQYLIARDVIEADVVINVPKLKTHKKAGITGALKNIVGMNGHKEYLPHHRKGGSLAGGDCYSGSSLVKHFVEEALDAANRAQSVMARRALGNVAVAGMALAKLLGQDNNYDGSWHGNDTVWRMTLDLQRILHYGMTNGTLSDRFQRKVLTITDAIIAGQGEGPLFPTPADLGIMTLGMSPPAIEWVHAVLMGLDPERIPLTREAFRSHRYGLADFPPSGIVTKVNGEFIPSNVLFEKYGKEFRLPAGWHGHVETCHPKNRTQSRGRRVEGAECT